VRITFLGSGGVGGYFGGRLAASGADVVFVARGEHLRALQTRGLRIESPAGNVQVDRVHATDDPRVYGEPDVIFVAVKCYDSGPATTLMRPIVGQSTVVIPLQNGVDGVETMTKAFGRERVAGGTCYVSAVIGEPGVIRHTSMNRLIFGELDGHRTPRLEALHEICQRAGIDAVLSTDIQSEIWTKLVRLSVLSGLTTVTRCPAGVIYTDPELSKLVEAGLSEAMAVARAKGIHLPFADVAEALAGFRKLAPETRSSMLEDLERGNRLELPWLSGALTRIGRELDVPTPTHAFISAVLGPYVQGRQRN
jgi:2-dehydropantoate 2-reductase